MTTCESATCRLQKVTPERAPFTEFNDSEGVAGDAWIVANPTEAEGNGDGGLASHNIVVFGHIAGDTFTGDILWESLIEPVTGFDFEPITRIGRGPCTLQRLPQGFFDDYNEL